MSFSPAKTTALVWACTKGPRIAVRWLAPRMATNPTALGTLSPVRIAQRLNLRLEHSESNALPFANVLRLVHPVTNAEVYVLATLPHAPGSQADRMIRTVNPEVVLMFETGMRTVLHPHTPTQHVPLSNKALRVLDWKQVGALHSRVVEAFDPATTALRTCRSLGIPVALVGPQEPSNIPLDALRAVMERALQMPPHLFPYDPVVGATIQGERCLTIARRLHEAGTRYRRVAAVIPLECVPMVHTLWGTDLLGVDVDFGSFPSLAVLPPEKPYTTLLSKVLPAGDPAAKTKLPADRAREVTEGASLTTRAVIHWLRSGGSPSPSHSPLVRRRILPRGQAVIEWDERPGAEEFYREVEDVQRLAELGPEAYEPRLIQAAWRNITNVLVNGLLLANGRTALGYPGIHSLFVHPTTPTDPPHTPPNPQLKSPLSAAVGPGH
jgi:hypothetical protein